MPMPSQKLPSREANVLKQVMKCYEQKQYKKGMKLADQLLQKFPMHGETLAMKALLCNVMNRKSEVHALAKKGLAMNLKSHTCWHVYGLIYRSEQKYDDAIKCYLRALKIDTNNHQIMRDLSNLQIQRRMVDGFCETRRQILVLRPTEKNNWIAFAVGRHLTGDHDGAVQVINKYISTVQDDFPEKGRLKYPCSELLLYRNLVIAESGDIQKALDDLDGLDGRVCDMLYWHTRRAHYLHQLGRTDDEAKEYRALLAINPENLDFHRGLWRALRLDAPAAPTAPLLQLYEEDLAKEYPDTTAVARLPLDFLRASDAAYMPRLVDYCFKGLRGHMSSLFRDLRSLYDDADKVAVFQSLLDAWLPSLRTTLRFTPQEPEESPAVLVWTLLFAAQHFDHLGDHTRALELVQEAIEHTPTNIEAMLLRARIRKHAGDPYTAFVDMNETRHLDLADRYLNTKCTRFALRAGRLEDAQRIVALFLPDGERINSLYDMQASWYGVLNAEAHMRDGNLGMACKRFDAVMRYYDQFMESQFDFHSYCLRKVTLRAYLGMLRWCDTIKAHHYYVKAALGMVRAYVLLSDNRARNVVKPDTVEEDKELTREEKRALAKKRRAERKAARLKEQGGDEKQADKKELSQEKHLNVMRDAKDETDGTGSEFCAADRDVLGDASRVVVTLGEVAPDRIEVHLAGALVYGRRNKLLLELRCLNRAVACDATHPGVHVAVVSFLCRVQGALAQLDDSDTSKAVRSIVEEALKKDALSGSAEARQAAFMSRVGSRFSHCLGAARAVRVLAARGAHDAIPTSPAVSAQVATCLAVPGAVATATRAALEEGMDLLQEVGADAARESLRVAATARFPLAYAFWTSAKQGEAKQAALDASTPVIKPAGGVVVES